MEQWILLDADRIRKCGSMKICQNCFQELEAESEALTTPAEVLGDIFLEAGGCDNSEAPSVQDARRFCPSCREKLGIVNLLGFGS